MVVVLTFSSFLPLSLFLSLESSSSFPLPLDSLVNDVRWITTLITKRNPHSSFLCLLLLHLLNFLLVHKLRALYVISSLSLLSTGFTCLSYSSFFYLCQQQRTVQYGTLHVNVCCMRACLWTFSRSLRRLRGTSSCLLSLLCAYFCFPPLKSHSTASFSNYALHALTGRQEIV